MGSRPNFPLTTGFLTRRAGAFEAIMSWSDLEEQDKPKVHLTF